MMLKSVNFKRCWYNGGNWAAFFILWFIFSGLMYTAEHSKEEGSVGDDESINKEEVKMVIDLIKEQRQYLAADKDLQNHLDKLLIIMEKSPDMAAVFGKLNLELALMKDDMMTVIVKLFKEEFLRIRSELDEDDISKMKLTSDLVQYFSSNKTIRAFSVAGEAQVKDYLDKHDHHGEESPYMSDYGQAVHMTSTIFTTLGYGWVAPGTTLGKVLFILIIFIQLPFYIHCLSTLATKINRKLDGLFNYSAFMDDDEDLTVDVKKSSRTGHLILLKGAAILGGMLLVHTLASSVYHYLTGVGSFVDALYFEFSRLSTVALGDILPEEDLTLTGAILKNILINIPSQILMFTIFVRILPILS